MTVEANMIWCVTEALHQSVTLNIYTWARFSRIPELPDSQRLDSQWFTVRYVIAVDVYFRSGDIIRSRRAVKIDSDVVRRGANNESCVRVRGERRGAHTTIYFIKTTTW